MDIINLFNKYDVIIIKHNFDFIDKSIFPENLLWVYDLLNLIPITEQTEREEYIDSLPEGLIRELNELFENSNYFEWNTFEEENLGGGYYSYLIQGYIESKYIAYTWEEKLPEQLKYFQEEAFRIINQNSEMLLRFSEQKDKVKLPDQLSFILPFVSMIDLNESIDNNIKFLTDEFTEISFKMLASSNALREKYQEYINENLKHRINILIEASNQSRDNFLKGFIED